MHCRRRWRHLIRIDEGPVESSAGLFHFPKWDGRPVRHQSAGLTVVLGFRLYLKLVTGNHVLPSSKLSCDRTSDRTSAGLGSTEPISGSVPATRYAFGMERAFRLVTLVILLALSVSLAQGQRSTTYQTVRYDAPPGWRIASRTASLLNLRHTDDDENQANILMTVNQPMQGTLRVTFREAIREATGAFEMPVRSRDIERSETRFGLSAVFYEAEVDLPDSRDDLRLRFVGFESNQRFHMVALMQLDEGRYFDRENEFETLVASMVLPGQPDEPTWDPATPPEGYGGLDGFFHHSRLSLMPNVFGGLDTVIYRTHYVFFPDGRMFVDLPEGGIGSERFEAVAETQPDCIGCYRIADNRLAIESIGDYGFVETEWLSYEPDDENGENLDALELDGDNFIRASPATTDRLDQSWGSLHYSGGPEGSVSSSKGLTLRADGTFECSSFFGASSTGSNIDTVTYGSDDDASPDQTGRYTLDGYHLTLNYRNGTSRMFTYYTFQSGDTDIIMLDGDDYQD